MRIRLFTSLEQLAQYADDWDRLAAGMPFRGFAWLGNWWRSYGPQPVKIGGRLFYRVSDIESWLTSLGEGAQASA